MNVVGTSRSLSERLGACYLPSGVQFGTPPDKYPPYLQFGAYQVAYPWVGHLISTCPAALHGRAFPRIRRTQKDTDTHRAQPLAELSLTERSEVLRPSEARRYAAQAAQS